jgi:hypothetical protein
MLHTDAQKTADNAGRFPLDLALVHGHKEAAKLLAGLWEIPEQLLETLHGFKPTGLEKELFRAAGNDDITSARLLIRLGVNLEAKGSYGNYPTWGGTALIEAIWYKKAEMAKFLLSSGADKMARDNHTRKLAVKWAQEYGLGQIVR